MATATRSRPRRGAARSEESEEPTRSRRSSSSRTHARERDEEPDREERSATRTRRPRSEERADREKKERSSRRSASKGWDAYRDKKSEQGEYAKNFTLPDDDEIIKILDEEPFAVVSEHWIDELKGKKSFLCLEDNCPLCDVGEKPRVFGYFNILDLTDPEKPSVKPWKCSTTTMDKLEKFEAKAPLNDLNTYFSVYKTGGGKKGRVEVVINRVKAHDLEEDWDIVPFSEDELDEFELLGEDDVLFWTSKSDLQDIADDLD